MEELQICIVHSEDDQYRRTDNFYDRRQTLVAVLYSFHVVSVLLAEGGLPLFTSYTIACDHNSPTILVG